MSPATSEQTDMVGGANGAGWATYRCPTAPFAVEYPAGWTVDETMLRADRLFFRPPAGEDAISLNFIDTIRLGPGAPCFKAVAKALASSLRCIVTDYRETAVVEGPDAVRIDFAGAIFTPGAGALYLLRHGDAASALYFFAPRAGDDRLTAALARMMDSLRVAD